MRFPRKLMQPNHPISLLLVVIIILVSYFFSIRGISHDMIRRDELTTLGHIGALEPDGHEMSIADTVASMRAYSEQHPPVYFILANVWGRVFSYHNVIIKLLSVFCSTLALATIFRLAKDVGGWLVGLYSLFLASTSVLFLFYTHDIRQYILALFLTALTWLLYRRFIFTNQPLRALQIIVFVLVMAGTVYTHYSTIFILLPIGIYHLLFVRKTKLWLQVSGSFALAGVLFLPWLPIAIDGLGGHSSKIDEGSKSVMLTQQLVEESSRFFGNGHSFLFVLLTVLFLASAISHMRGSRYALFYFIASALTIIVMNEYFQIVSYMRYVIVFTLPLTLCAGFGLAFLHRWQIMSLVPILICVAWIVVGTQFVTDDDMYEQTQTIVPQFFVEFNHLIPLLQERLTSDAILVPVVRHYSLTRYSQQKKKSIQEYYLSWLDMPYTNIYSGRLARDPFVLEDVWQDVQGYESIWLTYPEGDLYEIRKFQKQIKDTYTLCETMEYGERSTLEHYILNEHVDGRCLQ